MIHMSIIIKANNLIKSYTSGDISNTVLRNVSLEIHKGEFIAIMGRSGAGKSTLLYQLSLLDHPTSGEIFINDIDTNFFTQKERTNFRLNMLGYVFQDYALLPELTARENVAVPLLMQGKTKKEAYQKSTIALTQVGLDSRLHNLPSQLSGGEQQRVSIARAIAHEPKILFADEPTANLDFDTSMEVISIFKKLNAGGQTIVMVTHEKEYSSLADRIILIHDGSIVNGK